MLDSEFCLQGGCALDPWHDFLVNVSPMSNRSEVVSMFEPLYEECPEKAFRYVFDSFFSNSVGMLLLVPSVSFLCVISSHLMASRAISFLFLCTISSRPMASRAINFLSLRNSGTSVFFSFKGLVAELP
jgi:hypothetical protein